VQSNYRLKHGEAVVGGIFCALFLSEILDYMTPKTLNVILRDFSFIKPHKKITLLNANSVFSSMSSDKKSSMGKSRFVVVEDIGNIVVDVVSDKSSVLTSIEKMNKLV